MSRLARPARRRVSRSRTWFECLESRRLCAFTGEASINDFAGTPDSFSVQPIPDAVLVTFPNPGGFGDGGFGDGGFGAPPPSDTVTPLKVIMTDPAQGAVLSDPIRSLTVTFNRPIYYFLLPPGVIQLSQVADDGSLYGLGDATVAPGTSGNQLVLALGRDLAPGHYRIFLSGASTPLLLGIDGSRWGGGDTDQALADFWVVAKGVGLGDAIDLGTPGSTPTSTPGNLDFRADPNDVRLYKITLPAGHFWRLGLEVTAERDGGTLDSALALFDAQGNVIATDEVGRKDASNDPFLFAGLGAGTYYIGVSGTRDLPGALGGYDPATASAGSVLQTQAGGPFTLHVVADPADDPISLLSLDLDWADPLDSSATGFTLGFSGAIRLDNQIGSLFDYLSNSIEVVDQGGRVWPVAAVDYNESSARVSFVFRERLPAGHYTVRLPRQGGLVDLAGHSPVAPGQPAGVLGEFSVGPDDEASHDPHDLGSLLPDAAASGVSVDAEVDPGDPTSYRIVITFPGMYTLQSQYSGGPLTISLTGPDGAFPVDAGKPDVINPTNDSFLTPGIYQIRLTATGSQPVLAHLTFKSPLIDPESILENGVGQGPGLSLRLIAPLASKAPPASPPAPGAGAGNSAPLALNPSPAGGAPAAAPASPPAPGTGNAAPPVPNPAPTGRAVGLAKSPTPAASQQVSSGLFLGVGSDLVGRPLADARHITAVGPGTDVGVISLAYGTDGLLPRVSYGSSSSGSHPSGGPVPSEADVASIAPIQEARVTDSGLHGLALEELLPVGGRRLARLSSAITRGFEPRLRDAPSAEASDAASLARAEAPPDEAGPDPAQVEQPGAFSPDEIMLAAVLIGLSFHRIYRRWNRTLFRPARSAGLIIRSGSSSVSGRRWYGPGRMRCGIHRVLSRLNPWMRTSLKMAR